MSEMRNSFDLIVMVCVVYAKTINLQYRFANFCEHMDVHRVLLNVNCSITLFFCEISESHPGRL